MKLVCLFLIVFSTFISYSQDDNEEEENVKSAELGFDGFANASTYGGSFGLGVKYGILKNENIIFGPSLRIQRTWSNYFGQKYGFNIYGGGGFVHYRFQKSLFLGVELEFLKSPINYTYVLSTKQWIPTCFVGGGFSHEFKNIGLRINASIYYDIINNLNSPFRTSYIMKKSNNTLMPLIYRIGFFFPLN